MLLFNDVHLHLTFWTFTAIIWCLLQTSVCRQCCKASVREWPIYCLVSVSLHLQHCQFVSPRPNTYLAMCWV